ncbi:hypothetical protein [Flavobacterium palustre]|uniref:hypothetical protein n=1 Tax=Flavobacterium palustre TaxID=1476463 RepID=UPI001663A1EB|nr:hypothetical protein [Flavobacterium palustre]
METLSATRQIRRKHQPPTRCTASKKQQVQLSSVGTPTDGFLRHPFLPLYEQNNDLPESKKTETEFFESLRILTEHYGFETIAVRDKSYPYNILLAKEQVQKQLKKLEQDIELSIMQDDKGIVKLATMHSYYTNMTLYYIPVLPLYRLLQDKKQKRTAELLLSVFAYLYHIAGIPYYRESNTYLFYQYECVQEWLMDWDESDETEEVSTTISEFNKASYYGDIMFRKIYNLYHLNCFEYRINSYKPSNPFEKDCHNIAKKAWELMEQYPEHNIFRNTSNEDFEESDGVIMAEQYISFIGENEGILFENISRTINDEFNECGEIEEPKFIQIYDTENRFSKESLDFEYRLFPLLTDLCTLLNNMP